MPNNNNDNVENKENEKLLSIEKLKVENAKLREDNAKLTARVDTLETQVTDIINNMTLVTDDNNHSNNDKQKNYQERLNKVFKR